MAETVPCQLTFIRHAPDRPIVAFFRFYDHDGNCALALPVRLNERVTRFNEIEIDPTLRVEYDCAEPDARIGVSLRPCGTLYYFMRRFSGWRRRLTQRPVAPSDAQLAERIVPWRAAPTPPDAEPLVSFIIPTRDRADLLERAVATLYEGASWKRKELVIVDNGSVEQDTLAFFDRLEARPDITILRRDEPFNYARLINAGARATKGDILVFLNNDVETDNEDWLRPLVELALDPKVGVVGAKLLFEDGLVQHAGIVLGMRGLTGHAGAGFASDDPGPANMLITTRRVSAVTGACTLTRRDVFEALGGYDENFVVEFNDVDYCLRAGAMGLAVICATTPMLIHKEGSTRRSARPLREQEVYDRSLFMLRWGRSLVDDPYYSRWLTLADESLRFVSERAAPAPPR